MSMRVTGTTQTARKTPMVYLAGVIDKQHSYSELSKIIALRDLGFPNGAPNANRGLAGN
jgi:hypothetical protein